MYYLLGVDVMHSIKQLEEDVFSLSLPTAPVIQRDTIYSVTHHTDCNSLGNWSGRESEGEDN